MNAYDIGFRVDASTNVGGGHLIRSIQQINELLLSGYNVILIVKGLAGLDLYQDQLLGDIFVLNMDSSLPYNCEADYLLGHNIKSKVMVFDLIGDHNLGQKSVVHSMFDSYSKIAKRLVLIDGVGTGSIFYRMGSNHALDLIVRPYATAPAITSANLLSGYKYFIYPREYYVPNALATDDKCDALLITFGQSDPYNLTEIILDAVCLLKNHQTKDIYVTIGCLFDKQKIANITAKFSSRVKFVFNERSLVRLLKKCDTVICGTGLTKYEAGLYNNNLIVCSYGDTDYKLQRTFELLGGTYHIGPIDSIADEQLVKELENGISNIRGFSGPIFNVGTGLQYIVNRYIKLIREC